MSSPSVNKVVNGGSEVVNGGHNGELMDGVIQIETAEHAANGSGSGGGSSSSSSSSSEVRTSSSSSSEVRTSSSSISSGDGMNQTVINVYELNGKKKESINLGENEKVDVKMGGKGDESSKRDFMKAFKSCSEVVVINDDSEEEERVVHTPLKNNPITNFFKVLPPKNNP